MTTLTSGGVTLDFTDDLLWTDEFTWSPTVQSKEWTITGALVIQSGIRLAGRPMTLAPTAANAGMLTRAQLIQCYGWANAEMSLTFRGATYVVRWRHEDGAIDAAPWFAYSDPVDNDYYRATLRLMTV